MARGVTSNSRASSPIEYSLRSPSSAGALERVLILQSEDVDVRAVGTGDHAAPGRRLVIVDVSVLHLDERVAQIELARTADLVSRAEGKPHAVVVGQPHAARFGIRYRRLVPGDATLQRPRAAQLEIRAGGEPPGVAELENQRVERGAARARERDRVDTAPFRPGRVGEELPVLAEVVHAADGDAVRGLQLQVYVAVRDQWRSGERGRPVREARRTIEVVVKARAIVHAEARRRQDVEKRADVETPGIAIDAGRVLTFDAGPANGAERACAPNVKGSGRVVDRSREVYLAVLVADAAADADGVAYLEGHGGIDVDRLHFRLDPLKAADPVRVIFCRKPEGHADAKANVPFRTQVHGEKEARHKLRFAGVTAVPPCIGL